MRKPKKAKLPSSKECLFVIADTLMVISGQLQARNEHDKVKPLPIYHENDCPICKKHELP